MSFLLDLVIEALAYLSWRMWLCFIVTFVIAYLSAAYDIAVVWRYDIPVLVVLIGIGTGVYWEVESKDLPQR